MAPVRRFFGLFVCCFLLFPAVLHADVLGYLKVHEIIGEVIDEDHPGYEGFIEILGFGQGVSVEGGDEHSPPTVNFQSIRVTKAIDSTSPIFFEKCLLGVVIAAPGTDIGATIEFVKDGVLFYKIELMKVKIKAVVPAINNVASTEMLTFLPEKIKWTAYKAGGTSVIRTYDLITGQIGY